MKPGWVAWLLWPLSPVVAFLFALTAAWLGAGFWWSLPAAVAAFSLVNRAARRHRHLAEWLPQPPSRHDLTGYASDRPRPLGARGEIGMGGPSFGDMLLPDGALLRGVSDMHGVERIAGSPLYLAAYLERGGATAVVYDSAKRRVHDLKLPFDTPLPALLAACATDPAPRPLWPVLGLWLDRAIDPPPPLLERRLPSGRQLSATRIVPEDLGGAADPEHWAVQAPYRLRVDGRPTAAYVYDLTECAESPSGDAFVVRGVRLNEHGGMLWHIRYRGAFYTVAASADAGAGMTCTLEAPALADGGRVTWRVCCRQVDDGRTAVQAAVPQIDVHVHWSREPQRLTVTDGSSTLTLPARLPWTALRY